MMKMQASSQINTAKKLTLKKESIRVLATNVEPSPTGWWCLRTSRAC